MKKILIFIFGIFLINSCENFSAEQKIYKTKGGYVEVSDTVSVNADTVFSYTRRDKVLHEGEQLWAIWYDSYYTVPPNQSLGHDYMSSGNLVQDYNDNKNYILIITRNPPYILGESGYMWVEDIFGDRFVGFKIAHRVR